MKIAAYIIAFILIIAGAILWAEKIGGLVGFVLVALGAVLLGNTVRRQRNQ